MAAQHYDYIIIILIIIYHSFVFEFVCFAVGRGMLCEGDKPYNIIIIITV